MQFSIANNVCVYYKLSGCESAPRLVFITSLGTDFCIWGDVIDDLQKDFRCLCYDKRGHSLTDSALQGNAQNEYSLDLLTDDLHALLQNLGWSYDLTLIGVSVGGLIAQNYAYRFKESVSRLVLMGTGVKIGDERSWNERINTIKMHAISVMSEQIMARWLTDDYKVGVLRSPSNALLSMPTTISEITGSIFSHDMLGKNDNEIKNDNDLIVNYTQGGNPVGQHIMVYGRVLDEDRKLFPNSLLEIWQANAGGRYRHKKEMCLAAVDSNFSGCGRTIIDENGHMFCTIKPRTYPWPNDVNDWRLAYIHFSLFGHVFAQRLVTQMYFEGDLMIWHCPIVKTIPDPKEIQQLIVVLDCNVTTLMDCLAYKFAIVLRGRNSTLFENRMEGN